MRQNVRSSGPGPMTDDPRLARAEARVDEARERLFATVEELATQLEPRRLMRELWQDAKEKGADLAEEAVDAVKARPVAAGGAVAALALFLAREPLLELAGKVTGIGRKKGAKANGDGKPDTKRRKGAKKDRVETIK